MSKNYNPKLPWQTVRRELAADPGKSLLGQGFMRQAAVASIFRNQGDKLEDVDLLFIRRAEREGDPWSGHMAFPGGKKDEEDSSLLAAALRETREEIDLDLGSHGNQFGTLSHVHAMAGGKPVPMMIAPFLFELLSEPEFRPNYEVQEVVWIPLSFLLDDSNRSTLKYKKMGINWDLPCYRFEGRVVWGLTLKMVDELLMKIRAIS